jgi:tetratricopeptide (TPR) repeat protein
MSLPYAAGSLYSTVQDLYAWDQALYTEKLFPERLKELLFKNHISNYGYGWNIRSKKLPDSEQKLRSISHGGGINGFSTLIERLVDDRHLIILLNNTPGANLGQMSNAIIHVLYDKPYTLPKRSIAAATYKTLKEKDVQIALKQYETFRKDKPEEYDFSAAELNNLGYYLLISKKRSKDAIEIFKFNIKIFPKYANGYDSLAEAYMMAENTREAIINFAKSLELNPDNTNAIDKLNELIKKK